MTYSLADDLPGIVAAEDVPNIHNRVPHRMYIPPGSSYPGIVVALIPTSIPPMARGIPISIEVITSHDGKYGGRCGSKRIQQHND